MTREVYDDRGNRLPIGNTQPTTKPLIERIETVEIMIEAFKQNIRETTEWETGYNILKYIDTKQALHYGKLLGHRDCLEELLSEGNDKEPQP